MNILVTGGAGYVGSHACKALSAAGLRPVVVDNLVYGHRHAVRWGPLEVGQIEDTALLDAVFRAYRPHAVMHFAAYACVGESVADPGKYYRNNVMGSLSLLEACKRHGVDRLVFSSTCAVYGVPGEVPISEDHPQQPINPYGASKLVVERMLNDYGIAHGLRSIALRYFNAAGADPEAEIGEAHDPETHLIPLVLDAAAGVRPRVVIHGTDYPTPDGTCIRDYIHVTDLAAAHVLALARLDASGPGMSAYNLGNQRGYSVRQLIETTERVTGLAVPSVEGPRRPGDPPVLVGDATRAIAELGWRPQLADLDTIVETAWRWHQRHLGRVSS